MKTAIVSMLALVVLTAFGSYYQSPVVPYAVIGAICAVVVLVALGKVRPREYPIYLYGMSLALLWQTTMLGSHIVGADIHGEFLVANRAVAQGWDLSYPHIYNTSAVLGVLSPMFAKLGIPVLWQFKALYPAVFALVPVILYFAYKKMMGGQRAFWASLFFVFVPVFFVEVVGIVKSMVAEVFFALMVLLFVLNMKTWKKALGIGLLAILASFCHYTIGTLAMFYLIGGLFVLLICKAVNRGIFRKVRMSLVGSLGLVAIAVVAFNFIWFSNVVDGCVVRGWEIVGGNMKGVVAGFFDGSDDAVITQPSDVPAESASAVPSEGGVSAPESGSSVPEESPPIGEQFYLYGQEPLVRTAIGLDFGNASVGGKVFRILQYLTEFLIALGFGYLLFRHRKYKITAEFEVCIWASFILLLVCIFLPAFSSMMNVSRLYQITLFFLAPMLVIGVEEVGSDISKGVGWAKDLLVLRM